MATRKALVLGSDGLVQQLQAGDVLFGVGGVDLATSNRLPSGDVTLGADLTATVVGDCEIPSTFVIEVLSNSCLEIS